MPDIVTNVLYAEIDQLRARVKELEAERDAAQGEVERLKMELEATRKELGDKTWRLRRPYEAWLSDSLKKDNCRNCKHSRPPTIAHNPDRVSCQYADGWPHWTNKCDRWEAREALGGKP